MPDGRAARRIVRSRGRGVPLPENTVYVGRPTMWGNPFMGRGWKHAKSVILHRRWLLGGPNGGMGALTLERMGFSLGEVEAMGRLRARVHANIHRLAGKDLACWCPRNSRWCHADTLVEMANSQPMREAA